MEMEEQAEEVGNGDDKTISILSARAGCKLEAAQNAEYRLATGPWYNGTWLGLYTLGATLLSCSALSEHPVPSHLISII